MILWARRMSFLDRFQVRERVVIETKRYHSVSAFGSSTGTFTGISILCVTCSVEC